MRSPATIIVILAAVILSIALVSLAASCQLMMAPGQSNVQPLDD